MHLGYVMLLKHMLITKGLAKLEKETSVQVLASVDQVSDVNYEFLLHYLIVFLFLV